MRSVQGKTESVDQDQGPQPQRAEGKSAPRRSSAGRGNRAKGRTENVIKSGRTAFATHEEYFAAQPAEVRPILEWIQKTTEKVAPGAFRRVSYGMPAFQSRKVFLYFAAFKEHIGIYPPLRGDTALISELEPFRGPKGNLAFPLSRPFPKALVKRVVIALAEEHGGGKK